MQGQPCARCIQLTNEHAAALKVFLESIDESWVLFKDKLIGCLSQNGLL